MSALHRVVDPLVGRIARSPVHDLLGGRVALLEWTGRRSGRRLSTPVNLARDGDAVVLVSRRQRRWWRNLRGGAPVALWLDGERREGVGRVAPPGGEAAALAAVHAAATGGRALGPDALRRRAADTVVVRIDLAPPPVPAAPLRGGALARRWLAACLAGELLGCVAPAVGAAAEGAGALPAGWAPPALVAAGTVAGAVLGLAQATALRPALPDVPTLAWVRGTAAGAAIASAIGIVPSALDGPVPPLAIGVAGALVMAAAMAAVTGAALARRLSAARGFPAAGMRPRADVRRGTPA